MKDTDWLRRWGKEYTAFSKRYRLDPSINNQTEEDIIMPIYEIPDFVKMLFEQGENCYRIIDYSFEMDNIEAMQYFLDCIGATDENIELNDGTQVIIIHPDFDYKLVIDSGGLGDFFSHVYHVTFAV